MATETRAAVLHAFGEPHRIETVELRDPGPGEIRVRVVAAGVCHSDVGQADGDWAIVTVGAGDAIRLAVQSVRPGGVVAVVGLVPQDRPVPIDMLDLVTYETRIVGSAYGSLTPLRLVPRIVELYRAGALARGELVSARLPGEAVDEAFAMSRRAEGLRPVLAISGDGRF